MTRPEATESELTETVDCANIATEVEMTPTTERELEATPDTTKMTESLGFIEDAEEAPAAIPTETDTGITDTGMIHQ